MEDLPFIEVKGVVSPPEKLVGNIHWLTAIGGTAYETETLHNVEGNIIVPPPFPAYNSAFGPNTIRATAQVDCEPPALDLKDSGGHLIPEGGSSNTETVLVEGDDGADGSGIDKIALTQTSGGTFSEEQVFEGEQTASQSFPKAGGVLADGGYEAAVHDKVGNVTSVAFKVDPIASEARLYEGEFPQGPAAPGNPVASFQGDQRTAASPWLRKPDQLFELSDLGSGVKDIKIFRDPAFSELAYSTQTFPGPAEARFLLRLYRRRPYSWRNLKSVTSG